MAVHTRTNAECVQPYTDYDASMITPSMLCAGDDNYKSTCQGDSGGPLVTYDHTYNYWMQIGVVSWGRECAKPRVPGVYARVTAQLDWIFNSYVSGQTCPTPS